MATTNPANLGTVTSVEAQRTAELADQSNNHPVTRRTAAVEAMHDTFRLPEDLVGGTPTMRERGETWLPKEDKESPAAYETRLLRSFLFPAYDSTWDNVCAKPFERPVTIVGDLPTELEAIESNADQQGSSLTEFAKQVQQTAHLGLALVIVDFASDGRGMTLEQERARGTRPYFVLVRATQLRGWRERTLPNGAQELTMLRYHETVTEPVGEFGERTVPQIRVWHAPIEPPDEQGGFDVLLKFRSNEITRDAFVAVGGTLGRWEVWRQPDPEKPHEWAIDTDGEHDYPGIPLVDHYTNREGLLVASPPLAQLAWKNLEHWQSASDQRHILRYARFAMLFQTGVSEEEIEQKQQVGPVVIIRTTSSSQEASLEYVEPTGAGAKLGEGDLARLRDEMESMGLQVLSKRVGTSTATGDAIDEGRQVSQIKAWVRGLEKTLRRCYEVAATWLRLELNDELKIDVHDNFTLSLRGEKDSEFLFKAWQADAIDQLTFLEEIQTRGVLDENRDLEAIILKTEEETKTKGRGLVGLGLDPANPDGETESDLDALGGDDGDGDGDEGDED